MKKLTAKQELFCKEYLIDLNATQAAIRSGYSEKTAAKIGSENLIKPDIQSMIQMLFDERAERVELDSDYVLENLRKTYELDICDILTDDMKSFKPIKQWPKQWRISISGVDLLTAANSEGENVESIIKKIKWPDKVNVLEKIGKHVKIGAFSDNIKINSGADVTPWSQVKASVDKIEKD